MPRPRHKRNWGYTGWGVAPGMWECPECKEVFPARSKVVHMGSIHRKGPCEVSKAGKRGGRGNIGKSTVKREIWLRSLKGK